MPAEWRLEMKVYHGSYTAAEIPKMMKSRFPKDFGEGFYCTELKEQAERWAKRYDIAVMSAYEYTPDDKLHALIFTEMTEQWL
ncbi:MAG: DUF3990 domain-containing protein, partial [Bacteroidales bacterium]|nr:DUF3990 domain-containing protein [Bacteroidales bacterium]